MIFSQPDSRSSVLRRFTEGQTFRVTLFSDINPRQIQDLASKGLLGGPSGPLHVIVGELDYVINIIKLVSTL